MGAVTLTWNRNPETNIAGYKLYFGENNFPATVADVGNVTNRAVTTVAGKTYFFYVTAYNTVGLESGPSATVTYTAPLAAPAAPSNLAGVAESSSQVRLSWRDNSTNETGFTILRKAGVSGTYSSVGVGANVTNYIHTGLVAGTQYFYKIRAYNSGGNSADSAEISVLTPSSTPSLTNAIPASAAFVVADTATRGNWVGMYGSKGAIAPYSDFALPTNCQINAYLNYPYTWANPSTDVRALQKRSSSSRFATRWEHTNYVNFYLRFKDTATQRVSFYFLDFDNKGRQQKVEFFDYDTGRFLAGTTISNFQGGVYSTWNLQGRVTVKFSRVAGPSAVLSGIFFDPAVSPAAPVHMVGADTMTSGTWKGVYGAQGHSIATETPSLPPYGSVAISGGTPWTWQTSTSDPTALQRPFNSSRTASAWYAANSFQANLTFTDTAYHRVSLYFVDFDATNRRQRVDVLDAKTGAVLDSTELSEFRNGIWLRYEIKGNVSIRVTRLAGNNAVLSGVFFDQTMLQL